jgi:MFS family permease
MLLAYVLPPVLIAPDGNPFVMLLTIGIIGIGIAILFIAFGKDHPEVPFGDTTPIPLKQVVGDLKQLIHMRFAIVLGLISFISLGIFNTFTTLIQNITAVPAVANDLSGTLAGILGGVLIIAGLVGLLIVPALSDALYKRQKTYARKAFLLLAYGVTIPVMIATKFVTDFTTLVILMAINGFFMLPGLAIAVQWIAEQTAPIPESESNNLLMYLGQIGGIVFILLVPALFNTGTVAIPNYSNALILFAILLVFTCILLIWIKERNPPHA